jgi:hypothetical protein
MRYRIGAWASAGFLVASFWALYLFPTTTMASTAIVTLARLTCPVAFVGSYFHFGFRFYWVLLANAATYALVGLLVEALRHLKPSTQL